MRTCDDNDNLRHPGKRRIRMSLDTHIRGIPMLNRDRMHLSAIVTSSKTHNEKRK